MATNRIKIEVDYGDGVAKIGKLEVGFKDLEKSALKMSVAIKKAAKDNITAMNGSLKAYQREKAALVEAQSMLATTNKEYRRYQQIIDRVQQDINKLTDTRKREEIALKNSANGIRQQIEVIKQERDNRKLSNVQYQKMTEQIERLEQKHRSLTNTVKTGTIAAFDQQIAALQREQREVATSREQIEKYEQQIQRLRVRKASLTGQTKTLNKASQSFSSSAGAAGATVTEFGRTIGDLPFGLIGITNNIQQLSQQFTDLQAKQGGFKNAMQSVMKTMMGPAGFVVLINIATSALLYFTRQKDKAKEKTEEFNDSMLLEIGVLKQLTNMYEMSNGQLGERNKIMSSLAAADADYSKALAELGNNEEARNELTQSYLRIRNQINESEQNRNKIAEENKELLSEELLSKEERNELERQYESLLSGPLNESVSRAIGQIKGQLNLDDQRRKANGEILKSTNDIAKAQEELNRLLNASEYDDAIQNLREYQEELRLLRNFTEGPERIAEEIRVLKEKLSEEAIKAGTTETATYQDLLLELLKKEEEFYQASIEQREEANEKEQERIDALAEINQKYLDDLEAQLDESGIIRLNQQERDAIAEAKALGASRGELIRIEQFYANERQKILDEAAAKEEEKKAKDAEKKKKQDEKNAKEALDNNKKRLEEFFDAEIEAMKGKVDIMSEVFSNFGTVLDELDQISQSRFERQINQLKEQRDIIRTNDALTKEEKEQQLTELQRKENDIQRKRIKSERDMFTLKQAIVLAEMVMKQKAFVQEQIMMAQLMAAQAKLATNEIALTGAKQTANATMSIGKFMEQLGPVGIAAFALSIGGVIASIVSARKKAQAEIAGLSDAPVSLGGGSSTAATPAAPSFNVVGASAQNQLAAAIAGQQAEPVKAYVVSSDVSTAQELDRKIVEGASI